MFCIYVDSPQLCYYLPDKTQCLRHLQKFQVAFGHPTGNTLRALGQIILAFRMVVIGWLICWRISWIIWRLGMLKKCVCERLCECVFVCSFQYSCSFERLEIHRSSIFLIGDSGHVLFDEQLALLRFLVLKLYVAFPLGILEAYRNFIKFLGCSLKLPACFYACMLYGSIVSHSLAAGGSSMVVMPLESWSNAFHRARQLPFLRETSNGIKRACFHVWNAATRLTVKLPKTGMELG